MATVNQLMSIVFETFAEVNPNQTQSEVYIITFDLLKGLIGLFKDSNFTPQSHWVLPQNETSKCLALDLLAMFIELTKSSFSLFPDFVGIFTDEIHPILIE